MIGKISPEMAEKINAMPVEAWWRMEDIVGEGNHSPELWKHLCEMDDGKHTHNEYLFVANQTRIRFMWYKPQQEEEQNVTV